MIQIDIVDYDNLSSLGMRITKYVNSNLRDIVRVLIDILETDPEFDLYGFFPRDYLMRKPQECRDRKSTRLNSSHNRESRMPSSA